MGFEFSETMAGTVVWDDAPGVVQPFRFEVTAHADSTREHLMTGRAVLHGKVYAPPRLDGAPADGIITIRPLVQRIIRYELAFTGADGKHYELLGQKDIRWLAPLASFTYLPAEIVDEDQHRVAVCETAFDLRHDGWSFLRSFRPI